MTTHRKDLDARLHAADAEQNSGNDDAAINFSPQVLTFDDSVPHRVHRNLRIWMTFVVIHPPWEENLLSRRWYLNLKLAMTKSSPNQHGLTMRDAAPAAPNQCPKSCLGGVTVAKLAPFRDHRLRNGPLDQLIGRKTLRAKPTHLFRGRTPLIGLLCQLSGASEVNTDPSLQAAAPHPLHHQRAALTQEPKKSATCTCIIHSPSVPNTDL